MIIRYMVNASGVVVEKIIYSYYQAEKLVRKLKYSKKCTLLSYGKIPW